MVKSVSAAKRIPGAAGPTLVRSSRAAVTLTLLETFASNGRLGPESFRQLFESEPMERVSIVKQGIHPFMVDDIAKRMSIPKERLLGALGLARATVERKVRENKRLSPDESSKVMGMARLVGQVQAMVEESGDPEGFDAAAWTALWLERPLPALGGRKPAELMDTAEGQQLVASLVARMQSGAYA